jgi:hypothetical protein
LHPSLTRASRRPKTRANATSTEGAV